MKYNNVEDKNKLLQSIIIGNVMSLSKSFNIKVQNELKIEYLKLDKCLLKIKGIQMIGFMGEFSINYLIPNKFSIGKYKSIGYGVL